MWFFSSALLFFACPTPPQQNQQSTGNQTVTGPNNTQNTPPKNPNSPSNSPQNGPSNGQMNQGMGQEMGSQGMGSNGQADAQPNMTPPSNNPDAAATTTEEGKENKPQADGEQTDAIEPIPTPEEQAENAVDAVQVQGAPPPENAEPTPVTDSLLIRVERIPSKGAKAKHSQEQVMEDKHVTFTGEAICADCEGPLILRVVQFLGPNDSYSENNLITEKSIEAGTFTIVIPTSETPVALELLVDKTADGRPSASEYFAVIEMAGQLKPTEDRSDLRLDATKRDFFTPAPMPGTQGPQ